MTPGNRLNPRGLLKCKLPMYAVAVGITAAIVTFGIALRNWNAPVGGDSPYFLAIAESLADNGTFVDTKGYYPTQPTASRAPGWPFVISLFLRISRRPSAEAIMRLAAGILHIASAILIVLLTARVMKTATVGLLAGLAFALNPNGLYYVGGGWSEVLFVFVALLACTFWIRGKWGAVLGSFLFGVCTLVRMNYVLFPVLFLMVGTFALLQRATPFRTVPRLRMVLLCTLLFLMPPAGWATRNYLVMGKPLLSTIRGETFYGANRTGVDFEFLGPKIPGIPGVDRPCVGEYGNGGGIAG